MAKLSQQLKERQTTGRLSRTQRVGQKQAIERAIKEEQRFEELKAKAKQIQEERFKDKVVTETYYEYIPKEYSDQEWSRMSQSSKDAILRQYSKGYGLDYYTKKGYLRKVQRTRTKTIPFTLKDGENTYESVYNELDPELKQFFSTPDELVTQKEQRISDTKQQAVDKQAYADQKIAEAKTKYDTKLKKARDYYEEKRGKVSDQRRQDLKDWLNKEERDLENEYEEESAKWRGYKEGLSKGISQLSQGKDIQFSDIEDYAWDVADYEENKERARNEQHEFDRKQKEQIKDLEEQGYKPMIIEKSYNGKTEEAYLEYYNPKATKPYVRVATFKSPTQIDVTNLKKSDFGVVPVQRTLSYAGKEYQFTSNLQLYSDQSGKLSTKYGSIGYNEQDLLKKQQDATYKAWQEQRGNEPLKDIEKVEKKTTVIDRGLTKIKDFFSGFSLDITGTSIPKLTISRKKEGDAGQELANSLAKAGYETIKTGYEKIPSPDIYIKQPSPKNILGIGGFGGISFIGKTSESDIKLADVKEKWLNTLTEKQETAYKQDLDKIGIEDIQTKTQTEYQQRFEDKYMKKLIYEEMTFEDAQKEFEKSDEAKQLQKNYENTVKNELSDLGFTKQGFVQAGAGIGKGALSLVPTTTKGAIITAGGVYAGYSALKLIPPVVAYTGTGVIGAYGGYKAFSPTSDPTERAGGLITLGIAGLTLGYGAYKYLRRPVVTTEKIKVPVKEFKTKKVIGFEDPTKQVVKVAGKTYVVDKTYFPKQKLSTQVIEGRRTVVTSQGRALLNKYFKLDLKPIYEGVPYADKVGYSKAFKRLTKYGYTDAQAKATLRYYQPKIIDTTLKKGIIQTTTVEGKATARGEFDILTEQPKITVDKDLGITTRYAKPKIDYYDFERSFVNIKGKDLLYTNIVKTSPYAKLGKRTTRFEDYSIVESGDIEKGVIKIGQKDGIEIFREAQYQDLKSLFAQRQILPLKRKIYFGKGETRIIKTGEPQVIEYDIDEITGIYKSNALSPAKIQKTPLSKTFGATEEIKNILSEKPIKQPKARDIDKVIEKLERGSTGSRATSQYYGTGQYERTVGGLVPQQPQLQQQYLKDLPLQNFQKQLGIKDLILIKQSDLMALKIGALTGIKVQSDLKTKQFLKTDLKLDIGLKNLIKSKIDLGLKQEAGLKQDVGLKTDLALKSQLKNLTTNVNLKTPTIRTPEIRPPTIRPVTLPPFLLKGKIEQKIRKKRKAENEFAYLPDFTARAIGLDPEILTQKQAQKRLKKILTGLEIRRGVKIKNVF